MRTREWLNRRTGETSRVPLGIDPGFAHNVGALDPVRASVRVAEARHGAGSIVPRPPAAPKTWREYAIIGREVVRELTEEAGDATREGFSEAFRAGLLSRLGDRVGEIPADISSKTRGRVSIRAAARVREAVRAFVPSTWVRAGNETPAVVQGRSGYAGGAYYSSRRPPELHVDADPATAVHEYIHHLQFAGLTPADRVGRFQAPWAAFYHDRTSLDDGSGRLEPLVDSKYGAQYQIRKDRWYDDYMGEASGLELAARVFQILSHGLYRRQVIGELLLHDPELVHFAVGFMLRFEP